MEHASPATYEAMSSHQVVGAGVKQNDETSAAAANLTVQRETKKSTLSACRSGAVNKQSVIRFGIDAEIDKALSVYCNDELRWSKTYWPRAFRSLVSTILESLVDKQEYWVQLSTSEISMKGDFLRLIIEELKIPVSHNIKVDQRRWIVHVLREVSVFRKHLGIGVRLPNVYTDCSDWPNDLEDKDDLWDSLCAPSLRGDVQNFILKLLDGAVPPGRPWGIQYYGCIKSHKGYPIVIDVPDDLVELVKDRIATVSRLLKISGVENLRPADLIAVNGVPAGDAQPRIF
jgi:hypothetical protein